MYVSALILSQQVLLVASSVYHYHTERGDCEVRECVRYAWAKFGWCHLASAKQLAPGLQKSAGTPKQALFHGSRDLADNHKILQGCSHVGSRDPMKVIPDLLSQTTSSRHVQQ